MGKKPLVIQGIVVSKVQYEDTLDGVAYYANLTMDGENIGHIENSGRGGVTNIRIFNGENYKEFVKRMQLYFNATLGLKTEGVPIYSQEYTFAEHLLDFKELGHLSSNKSMKLKFLR